MSWITDENGFGRRSKYTDLAEQPPQIVKRTLFKRAVELHRFQGQLSVVLTGKDREFLNCGNEVTYGVIDQMNALLSLGVQVGVARSWSKERTFRSRDCSSCVPVLRLTNATLTETAFHYRFLKPCYTKRTLKQASDCERHYEIDCVPKPDCPGCDGGDPVAPRDLSAELDWEASGEETAVTFSVDSADGLPENTGDLLETSRHMLEEMLDFDDVQAGEGVFVDGLGKSLVFVPVDIDSASPGAFPVAAISFGKEVERLGGLPAEAGAAVPVVLLASRSTDAWGWAAFVERDGTADAPEDAVRLERTDVGPFTLLCASLRIDDAHHAEQLVMRVSDESLDRSRTISIPLRRTQEEPVLRA